MSSHAHVFPLAFMREACQLAAKGYVDPRSFKLPPLVINEPAPAFVSCGCKPLSRLINVSGHNRFTVGRTCYIDSDGGFVFPA